MQLSVISRVIATPPVSPTNEDSYIVPAGATGVWAGQTNALAVFYNSVGGWLFLTPSSGWIAWSQADSAFVVFYGGIWQTASVITAIKGSFTLTASAATTTVADPLCLPSSVITPVPTTADAAQDATDLYLVAGNGQFIAHHASNSRIDRTFNYVLFI